MKLGWAYMGLACVLVLVGVFLNVGGQQTLGLVIVSASLVFIYLGSNALADDRAEQEASGE